MPPSSIARRCGVAVSSTASGCPTGRAVVRTTAGSSSGSSARRVHELPGTTFSNPAERGGYDSDRQAALTLDELTRWLALAVASYHGTVHSTLRQTPAGAWADGVARDGIPPVVVDRTGFLVDFLPVLRRRITRVGFVIDHVHYFGDVLKPWIARRDRLGRFVIRRDPRDISRIWVLDPDGAAYVPVLQPFDVDAAQPKPGDHQDDRVVAFPARVAPVDRVQDLGHVRRVPNRRDPGVLAGFHGRD